MCRSCWPPSNALDGADDARMRAAAAQIVGEGLLDVCRARLLALVGVEEGGRLHDHAVDAVAALGGLLVDEGLLQRMWILRAAQALERHHLVVGLERRQRHHARAHRPAVDMHRAGTALTKPAAEPRSVQAEIVAQRIE